MQPFRGAAGLTGAVSAASRRAAARHCTRARARARARARTRARARARARLSFGQRAEVDARCARGERLVMQVEELARRVAHDRSAAAEVMHMAGGGRGGRVEHSGHAAEAAALQRVEVAQQRRVRRGEARARLLEVRVRVQVRVRVRMRVRVRVRVRCGSGVSRQGIIRVLVRVAYGLGYGLGYG